MEARSRQPTAIAIVRHGKGARDCHGHRCVSSARGDTRGAKGYAEDVTWNARDGGVQRASVSQWAPRSNCDLRDAHATSQCCLEYLFCERAALTSAGI
jgi:hypothetical protein